MGEGRVPLSKSRLWRRQRRFYLDRGIEAWRHEVPCHATSNPGIADTYARIITGYLRDCLAVRGGGDGPQLILELGAGSGLFSFHLLRCLEERAAALGLPEHAYLYVMSDLVPANLAFWEKQEGFARKAAAGQLDFALFDLETDEAVTLRRSGRVLGPGAAKGMIVLANYIWDTLAQDVFQTADGRLLEGLVLEDPALGEQPLNSGMLLSDIDGGVHHEPVTMPRYGNPAIDGVLANYSRDLPPRSFAFPIGPLRSLDTLAGISGGRLLVLATDKGYSHQIETHDLGTPDLVFHGGCFSMSVNFHAIGRYFEHRGGEAFHQESLRTLHTSVFLLGEPIAELPSVAEALGEHLRGLAPAHQQILGDVLRRAQTLLSPEEIATWLAISGWDPYVVDVCFEILLQALATGPILPTLLDELCRGLARVGERVYPFPGSSGTLLRIGLLLQALGRHEEALGHYQRSLGIGEVGVELFFNMALCQVYLGRLEQATENLHAVLALDPGHILALGWLCRIEASAQAQAGGSEDGLSEPEQPGVRSDTMRHASIDLPRP